MSAVMSDDGHDKTEHDSSKQVDNDDIGQEERGVPDYYSDYDWEEALSDSDVESEAKGMDLAKADADALTVDLDGMYAKVEAHTSTTIRLWVCVEHWRLFEGLAPRTVETLGLDPSKDVVVMFTTDQQYTGSVEPKVQWARQVDPDKSKADDLCPEGRIGEIFPLQETLCQKLNEDLARMWPRAADRTRARRKHSHQRRIGAGASASDGSNDNGPSLQAGVTQGGGGGLSGHGGDRAAAAAAWGSEEVGAGAAAGGVAAGPDSSAARLAIESICGSTGGLREHVASAGKTSEAVHLEAITAHRTSGELQTNRRTAKRQCQSLSDLDGRTAKLEQLAETNPLARAALTITIKLRNANKNCLLCDDPIEGFLPAVPIVCPKEFCQWRSGQMRCGTDVESQVLKNGETVGLLINLFAMAIRSDRAELNFPDTAFKHVSLANDVFKVRQALRALPTVADMQLCIKRKRGKHPRAEGTTTTTSTSSSPAPPPLAEEEARKLTDAAHAATTKAAAAKSRAAAAERVAVGEASSDVAALADAHAADASPEVRARAVDAAYAARARAVTATAESAAAAAKSREAAQEAATAVARAAAAMGDDRASRFGVVGGGIAGPRGGEGDRPDGSRLLSLEQELTRRDPSSYGLLQWLLSTNRAYLRPLRESEHIPEIPCEKQFMFVTGTVHREAKFQEMKRKEVALSEGGKKTGSFYAFYGCAPGNWHGIFQEGFKNMSGSRSTSSGAALGSDIHMTTRLSVALGHAGGWKDSFIWKMGNNDMERGETPVIVAICEVIDRDSNLISDPNAGSYVVSDEECVATRFLLVNPSTTARAELFDADGGIQASHLTINPQA